MNKFCQRGGKHEGRAIEAVCLEKSCQLEALLCLYCVLDAHSLHSVVYFHQELNRNPENMNAEFYAQQVYYSFHKAQSALANLSKINDQEHEYCYEKIHSITNLIKPKVEAFKAVSEVSFYDRFMECYDGEKIIQTKLDKFIKETKLTRPKELNFQNRLLSLFNLLETKMIELIETNKNKYEKLFQVIENELLSAKIFNEEDDDKQVLQVCDILKNEENNVENHKAENNCISHLEEEIENRTNNNLQENYEINNEKSLKRIKKNEKIKLIRDDKNIIEIESNELEYPRQMEIKEKAFDDNEYIESYKSNETNEIKAESGKEINKLLKKCDINAILSIHIICDDSFFALDNLGIRKISFFLNLKCLKINWSFKLKKEQLLLLLRCLQKLEYLMLSEFQFIDKTIIEALINYTPNLKRLSFRSNCVKSLKLNEDAYDFFEDFQLIEIREDYLINLATFLIHLESFILHNVIDQTKWIELIKKKLVLKEIIISQFNKFNNITTDLTLIIEELAKKHTLEILILEYVIFEERALIELIKNNRNLKIIILEECTSVTNETLKAIANYCLRIEHLSLILMDTFEGEPIYNMRSLNTLIIKGCWKVNPKEFFVNIKNLDKIECLNISFNLSWVTNNIVKALRLLPRLEILNISNNNITFSVLTYLFQCKSLKTLSCGQTGITAKSIGFNENVNIMEFEIWLLKKLSLASEVKTLKLKEMYKCNERQHGKDLFGLAEKVPLLTHLNISGFQRVVPEHIEDFNNLQCIISDKISNLDLKKNKKKMHYENNK